MAAGTVPILMAQPSQVPAGARRAGGSREGANAVKFEDVLRELDRSGEPVTGAQAHAAGNLEAGAASVRREAFNTDGAKGPAEKPEAKEGATGDAEGSEPPRPGPAPQASLEAAAAAPAAAGELPAEGVVAPLEALLQALDPADASGMGQGLAGMPELAAPGAGTAGMITGLEETRVLQGHGQGTPGQVLTSEVAAADAAWQAAAKGVAQDGLPVLEAVAPSPARDAAPGLFGDLLPNPEGKVPGRSEAPLPGQPVLAREPGPGEWGQAVLQRLGSEQEAPSAAFAPAAEGASVASDLLPEIADRRLEGRAEGGTQGSSSLAHQREAGDASRLEARTTWSQLLEEMGLRFEPEGEPSGPALERTEAQPTSRPAAETGQPALLAGADGEPLPAQVHGGQAVQAPAGLEAPAQPAATAADVTTGTSHEVAPSRSDGAVTTPFAQLGDVVVKRLQQLRNPGSDELRLELEPKELGSLKIRLELRGDGVKAHFVVDRPVVQVMLDRAMAELRQALVNQGYQVEELQVALQGDEGQGRESFGDRHDRAGRSRGLRAGEVEAAVMPEAGVARWAASAGPGRIDIRV